MDDEIGSGRPDSDDHRSFEADAARRRRSRLLAAGVAVVVVVGGLIALVAVQRSPRQDAAPPKPSGSSQPQLTGAPASAPLLATATPAPSPAGPVSTAPADGLYLCQGKAGSAALCDDRTADVVVDAGLMAPPENVSIGRAGGFVYYAEPIFAADTEEQDQISRTPLRGGQKQVIVPALPPDSSTQQSFASPVVAPDSKLLAYRETVTSIAQPGLSATALPVTTGSKASIVIRDLGDLDAKPKIVPASLVPSTDVNYALLGWAADSTRLFFVGSDGTVKALSIGGDGTATAVATVFGPAAVAPGCAVARTLLAASGDFFVVASCKESITITRIHDGTASPWGALLNTEGWEVADATVDTTGHLVALSWTAPPYAPLCIGVAGSARIIDGVPTDVRLVTTPGCPSPEAQPVSAVPSSPTN